MHGNYNTFGSSIFSDSDSGCAVEEYVWVPPGLSPDQIRRFFAVLPEDKVPYPKSEGELYRVKQLTYQLPPQDCEPRFCRSLNDNEVQELLAFKTQRKNECLGRGVVRELSENVTENLRCDKCNEYFEPYQLAVFASRTGSTRAWHPQCFTCSECANFLVDLIYFYCNLDGRLYCGRHHAERYKPRCGACDELIFSDECTEAEGYTWHLQHFVCYSCEQPLASQRYLLQAQKPFCIRCYHETQSETCASCQQQIAADDPHISINGLSWHKTPRCYSCTLCRKPIISPNGGIVSGLELFCSPGCQSESAATELNKENLEALLATSITSPFEHSNAIPGAVSIGNSEHAYNSSDLLDPHSESFCLHHLQSHRHCPYHPPGTFAPEPIAQEFANPLPIRGRPPHASTISSQGSVQGDSATGSLTKRVHFPRSVSFPAEIDVQEEDAEKRKPRRKSRRHRRHKRHNQNENDDNCSTCSSSSSDSGDEVAAAGGFTSGVRFDPNQILMSSSASGGFTNGDGLSISSTGSNPVFSHQHRAGLYAGKHNTMGKARKKHHGSKNCLVS